jgi:hypothetical protein
MVLFYTHRFTQHQRFYDGGRIIGRIGPTHAHKPRGAAGYCVTVTNDFYMHTLLMSDLVDEISHSGSEMLNQHLVYAGAPPAFKHSIAAGIWHAKVDNLRTIIRARRKAEVLRAIAAAHMAGLPHVGLVAVCDAVRNRRLSIFWRNIDAWSKGAAVLEQHLSAELPASYQPPNHVAVLEGTGE